MSVRQYIGARYVPRFSDVNGGIWSNVYSYEPLTIVKNGNDYYTSKQNVPVGIAITNTDYWIKTGDYNGAISHLQSEIDNINSAMSGLDVSTKKILFVGDSYIAAHANTCVEYACSVLGITDYVNVGVSGAAISYTTAGAFVRQLENYSGSIPRDEFTDIIVIGGMNDATQPADGTGIAAIFAGMENFVDYAHIHYPNAKIMICFAGCAREDASLDGRTYDKRSWARMAYSRFSQSRDVKVHSDMCYCLTNPGALNSDHIHPSDAGHRILSNALVNYILGNDYHMHIQYQVHMFEGSQYGARFAVDGDTGTIQFGAQFVFNLPVGSYDGASDIEVATIADLYFNRPLTLPTQLIMASVDENAFYPCPLGRLRFDGNKLLFSAQAYDQTGLKTFTFTSSSRLVVQPCLASFPTAILT